MDYRTPIIPQETFVLWTNEDTLKRLIDTAFDKAFKVEKESLFGCRVVTSPYFPDDQIWFIDSQGHVTIVNLSNEGSE